MFPGGGDLLLLPLMGLEHANAGDPLPALGRYMQQAVATAAQQREEQQREEQAAAERDRQDEELEATAREREMRQQQERMEAEEPREQQERQQRQAEQLQQLTEQQAQQQERQQPAAGQAMGPLAAAAAGAQLLAAGGASGAATDQEQQAANGTAVPAAAQPGPAAAAEAAGGAGAGPGAEHGPGAEQWSDSQEVLEQEPSLSNLPSPQQVAVAAAAKAAVAAAERTASGRGGAAAGAHGSGHLISQRYRSSSEEREAAGSPAFQGWPAGGAAGAPDARSGSGRSAADAWDAAMAVERVGSAGEAPTPKFGWQSVPGSAPARGAEADSPLAGDGLASDPLGALQQQRGAAAPAPGRPGLQLRLAATRSLDPDFTTSAEHTGFGEAPAAALPDYSAAGVRRTLSAAHAVVGSTAGPAGAGATKETVGAALNRSLAYLRHQGSTSLPGSPPQQQQQGAGSPPQAAGSPPHAAAGSPPQERGRGSATGDGGRLRQNGSFKEQAGKLLQGADVPAVEGTGTLWSTGFGWLQPVPFQPAAR